MKPTHRSLAISWLMEMVQLGNGEVKQGAAILSSQCGQSNQPAGLGMFPSLVLIILLFTLLLLLCAVGCFKGKPLPGSDQAWVCQEE